MEVGNIIIYYNRKDDLRTIQLLSESEIYLLDYYTKLQTHYTNTFRLS